MFSPCLIKFAKGKCLSAGNTQYEVSILNTSLGRAAALDPLSGSGCSKHIPETGWSYAAAFTAASSFAAYEQAEKVHKGEITKEEYDSWRYNFSESDLPGIHVKVTPSQELSDALIRISKEKGED